MKVIFLCMILKWKKSNVSAWAVGCIYSKNVSNSSVVKAYIENEEQLNDLDKVFNTLANVAELDKILWTLNHKMDPNHKGFTELEDIISVV